MFSDATHIDASTVQAYLETDYTVHTQTPFALHIGELSTQLASLHRAHGVNCSAFITAWNPHSEVTDAQANAQHQQALLQHIHELSLQALPGVGQHPSNQWPGEESYLVLGLDLPHAKEIGNQFRQNAIVWAGADAVPALILLR